MAQQVDLSQPVDLPPLTDALIETMAEVGHMNFTTETDQPWDKQSDRYHDCWRQAARAIFGVIAQHAGAATTNINPINGNKKRKARRKRVQP